MIWRGKWIVPSMMGDAKTRASMRKCVTRSNVYDAVVCTIPYMPEGVWYVLFYSLSSIHLCLHNNIFWSNPIQELAFKMYIVFGSESLILQRGIIYRGIVERRFKRRR